MRILVVEDDKDVAGFIVKGLKRGRAPGRNTPITGGTGCSWPRARASTPSSWTGCYPAASTALRLLETLRAQDNKTPVMFLSALGQVDDRVRGLKAGGDDYLTKPFAFAELLARVEALARRGKQRRAADPARGRRTWRWSCCRAA